MNKFSRLPAIPLITQDPFMSIWVPGDLVTDIKSEHWCGHKKPIRAHLVIDGTKYSILGSSGNGFLGNITSQKVNPLTTLWTVENANVRADISFTAPFTPDDLDLASMPVTLVKVDLTSLDGKEHDVSFSFDLTKKLCFNGDVAPKMFEKIYKDGNINVGITGKSVQAPVSQCADLVSIDWGYLCLYTESEITADFRSMYVKDSLKVSSKESIKFVIAYDDIASINYFGTMCKPYFTRNGMTVNAAAKYVYNNFDAIIEKCNAWDERILADAKAANAEGYDEVVCAAYRQAWAAHKLIVNPNGKPVLLSKENNSNGCIGTVDVSYPSIPLFLKYCPELVNALCIAVHEFADMPIWEFDFAPHDVGRYPNATGQVYASFDRPDVNDGDSFPPYYMYPAGTGVYDFKKQMPVEECGNMLLMLAAAVHFGASDELCIKYRHQLDKWVKYLIEYGEDPGEQLCTDDFAGHLAHNVNLAMKAIIGVAAYSRITGDESYMQKAKEMANTILAKIGDKGNTPLTLDGKGWSMKYNMLWDKVLNFGLFSDEFYKNELASYIPRINEFGLPLDSRANYTKSDWLCWIAAMSDDKAERDSLIAPLAKMLRETKTRVPFSDFYDTVTGNYVAFIARSVQGGVFALMLR